MIRSLALSAAVMCVVASTARAEPVLSYKRLYLRAGVLHIQPLSDSRELALSGVHGAASLAVMDGPIAGSGATLDPLTIPAVIAGYTLPVLGDRLSLETVLSTPLHVTFRATGTLANMSIAPEALGIETGVPALGPTLGEADAAPPLVTLVYRLADLGPVHPYAGTGVGVLVTYNARATNPTLTEAGQPTFHIDPAPGWVLQTGVDVALWRRVFARVDLKYVAFMKAHATVEDVRVRTPGIPLFETAEVGTATMDMWVNPLIVQIGVGVDL
ncbi:MAG: OmpW family protein [Kofleriaceae bacterium]|nr:OmpW family protein [Kofleriaceae bacterium]